MDDVFVGSLMSAPVHTVSPAETIQAAAQSMLEHGIGSLVVVDDHERLAGILTATDFVRVAADDTAPGTTQVSEYMTEDVETARASDAITAISDRIVDRGYHHLPVVDEDGTVIGIVTTTDVTAYVAGTGDPGPPADVPTSAEPE